MINFVGSIQKIASFSKNFSFENLEIKLNKVGLGYILADKPIQI
jgi:hypothetical protein|tara:strand:+ start:196 stop:327 length:132 start_codon:yes stop_codon:yes gene_type:complete